MNLTAEHESIKTTTDLTQLVAEVNRHHRAMQELLEKSLDHAKDAGDALIKIKASLPHGEFGNWIAENCEFSDRTARTYMTIAESWGSIAANRKRFRNQSVRQAVKLLADDEADVDSRISLLQTSLGDHGHLPYDWEPGAGEARLGLTSDRRFVVLLSVDDPKFIRTAIIDVDGGFSDYDRRGINRHYLVWALNEHGVNPNEVDWLPYSDGDDAIVEAAFGEAA